MLQQVRQCCKTCQLCSISQNGFMRTYVFRTPLMTRRCFSNSHNTIVRFVCVRLRCYVYCTPSLYILATIRTAPQPNIVLARVSFLSQSLAHCYLIDQWMMEVAGERDTVRKRVWARVFLHLLMSKSILMEIPMPPTRIRCWHDAD